jgi:hypothetical protein
MLTSVIHGVGGFNVARGKAMLKALSLSTGSYILVVVKIPVSIIILRNSFMERQRVERMAFLRTSGLRTDDTSQMNTFKNISSIDIGMVTSCL